MTLSLSKLPWYGQVAVFAGLGTLAVFTFWSYYAQERQADIDTRRAQLAAIRANIDRGNATARRLPQFRQEVAQLQAQLDRLRTVLPEEQDVADLLRRVQGMATQSNLTIRGFTPQAVARRQMHMEWPIGLHLDGRYHDLGSFLERVSRFPRIINIGNLKIRAVDSPSGGATISAECTATTFVLIEPAGAPPVSPSAPALPAAPRAE